MNSDTSTASDCAVADCERQARDGRQLCARHAKRKQRGADLFAAPQERLPPEERLLQATLDVIDADPEDDRAWVLAKKRQHKAAVALGLSLVRRAPRRSERRGAR
jgi:hypothetical protein